MELDQGFKDRIKWAIQFKGSNQSELARHLGVTAQAVQQWVAGATQNPRRDHLKLAAEWLGCRYEWLAFGRGPMRLVDTLSQAPAGEDQTETALLSNEWRESFLAAMPENVERGCDNPVAHPAGGKPLRTCWVTDTMIAELGLYRANLGSLLAGARQKLWLLAVIRELLPLNPQRRTLLILSPLEEWAPRPDKHIDVLRAEARLFGIEVVHAATPEEAAAVVLEQPIPAQDTGDDIGVDAGPVI